MTRSSLADALARHRRISLDSNVLIYVLDATGDAADRAAEILDAVEAGTVSATMSTIGLTEVLTGPARQGDGARFELLATELRAIRHLRWVDVRPEIAVDAAWLHGAGDLGLEDAVHVATARASGATALITNDRRIRSRRGLEVIYLSDFGAP